MVGGVVRRVSGARDLGLGIRDSVRGQAPSIDDEIAIGRVLSAIEDGVFSEAELALLRKSWANPRSSESPIPNPQSRPTTPVVGITGTGGAGKSSVTDELLNRFLASFPQMRIAVIRSEEHTSELQSLIRISYAVFCLKKTHNKISN